MKIKKIGILTSGGDAPGMNSALFGVYSACQNNNISLYGFIGGYNGLIDNKYVKIDETILNGRINLGGSLLKSSRCPRFLQKKYFNIALKNIETLKLDAIIILGGDGTIRGARDLELANVKCVCIPCTIDNDLNFTRTLGYDTAINNLVTAIDTISDSLNSFGYGAVVKIMGRSCPDLINSVAMATHTNLVILSADYNQTDLVKKIKEQSKNSIIPPVVLVLEDCVSCEELSKTLESKCKFPFRPHILGYIQRGGAPTAIDRMYGYSAGSKIIDEILQGNSGFVMGIDGLELVKKTFDLAIKPL